VNADDRLAEVSAKLGDMPMKLATLLMQASPFTNYVALPSMPAIPSSLLSQQGQMPSVSRNASPWMPPSLSPGQGTDYAMPTIKKWSRRTKPPAVRSDVEGLSQPAMSVKAEASGKTADLTGESGNILERIKDDVTRILEAVQKIAADSGDDITDDAEKVPGLKEFSSPENAGGKPSEGGAPLVSIPASGFRPQRHVPRSPGES